MLIVAFLIRRKHHCPIHLSQTGNLIADHGLNVDYKPVTDYQSTFRPINAIHACRPALRIPPRVLHSLPSNKLDLVTVNRQDFTNHPNRSKTKSFKPTELAHMSNVPLGSDTSYKLHYPPRQLQFNPPSDTLMRTTFTKKQHISPLENYVTMNQEMLKGWKGRHYPQPFKEPLHVSFFQGKFDGQTVAHKDFNPEIILRGRPSTSFKKVETSHVTNADFANETTNKSTYTLPQIVRGDVHLRKDAKKNRETLDPAQGKVQDLTQYMIDNPGFLAHPARRSACTPAADSLQLFHGKRNILSEHQASFNSSNLKNPPRPRTSFKKQEHLHTNGGYFDGQTSLKTHFRPVPIEDSLAQLQEVDNLALTIGRADKAGSQVKDAQNYGERFSNKTTNKSHFQLWSVSPRVRHGDKSERVYQPSTTKPRFSCVSEAKSSFVPMEVEPSSSFKPLDVRFQSLNGKDSVEVVNKSAYADDFTPFQVQAKPKCPAELLQA